MNLKIYYYSWDVHGTQVTIEGQPAWSTEYDYTTDLYRPLFLQTNPFCSGGMLLPDARFMIIGGAEEGERRGIPLCGADGVVAAGVERAKGGLDLRDRGERVQGGEGEREPEGAQEGEAREAAHVQDFWELFQTR